MEADAPRRVQDAGLVIVELTDSEQRDLHHDAADGTSSSIPDSSISGSEFVAPSSSTGPRRMSTTNRRAAVDVLLLMFCACDDTSMADVGDDAFPTDYDNVFSSTIEPVAATDSGLAASAAAGAAVAAADKDDDDDNQDFPTDTQLSLALRAVYARHRHDLTLTQRTLMQKTEIELGGADLSTRRRLVNAMIVLIKLEEAEAEAARGRHAYDKQTVTVAAHPVVFTATLSAMSMEDFDDGARNDFAMDVAAGLSVPRERVRITGVGVRAGSVIIEASVTVDGGVQTAAAFASSLTDPANSLVDGRFGPCAVSGVRVEEPADDDNRHPEVDIEGRIGGLWDANDEEEEAVRKDSWVAAWDSGGASAAAAAATVGLQLQHHGRMISVQRKLQLMQKTNIEIVLDNEDDNRHLEEEIDDHELDEDEEDEEAVPQGACVLMLMCQEQEEPPWPAGPDDASRTGLTYDDFTKAPPPHLRCVVSPVSSVPPVFGSSRPWFLSPTSGLRQVQAALFARRSPGCLVLGCLRECLGRLWPTRYSRIMEEFIDVTSISEC